MATLTYVYLDSTAVLGPLAQQAEPHTYDLCDTHAGRLTAPRGWEVVRLQREFLPAVGPTPDDISALADAVREAGRVPVRPQSAPNLDAEAHTVEVGRRGHLRVLRDNSA